MFTGLIEQLGEVEEISSDSNTFCLKIKTSIAKELKIGDSIAISGTCLTVVMQEKESFSVQLVEETLNRTYFTSLKAGDFVNIERPLLLSSRIDGHFVQGHVDGVAKVTFIETLKDRSKVMTFQIPNELSKYMIEKGSITIDGISLTIMKKESKSLSVALIPHTLDVTTLGVKIIEDPVHIEVDLLAKYAENFTLNSTTNYLEKCNV